MFTLVAWTLAQNSVAFRHWVLQVPEYHSVPEYKVLTFQLGMGTVPKFGMSTWTKIVFPFYNGVLSKTDTKALCVTFNVYFPNYDTTNVPDSLDQFFGFIFICSESFLCAMV